MSATFSARLQRSASGCFNCTKGMCFTTERILVHVSPSVRRSLLVRSRRKLKIAMSNTPVNFLRCRNRLFSATGRSPVHTAASLGGSMLLWCRKRPSSTTYGVLVHTSRLSFNSNHQTPSLFTLSWVGHFPGAAEPRLPSPLYTRQDPSGSVDVKWYWVGQVETRKVIKKSLRGSRCYTYFSWCLGPCHLYCSSSRVGKSTVASH